MLSNPRDQPHVPCTRTGLLRKAETLAQVTDVMLSASELEGLAPALEHLHGAARRLFRCASRAQDAEEGSSRVAVGTAVADVNSALTQVRVGIEARDHLDWRERIAWRDLQDCCRSLAGRRPALPRERLAAEIRQNIRLGAGGARPS